MSYYGSEIEGQIARIVRYWEKLAAAAFVVGGLLGWALTSLVWWLLS